MITGAAFIRNATFDASMHELLRCAPAKGVPIGVALRELANNCECLLTCLRSYAVNLMSHKCENLRILSLAGVSNDVLRPYPLRVAFLRIFRVCQDPLLRVHCSRSSWDWSQSTCGRRHANREETVQVDSISDNTVTMQEHWHTHQIDSKGSFHRKRP